MSAFVMNCDGKVLASVTHIQINPLPNPAHKLPFDKDKNYRVACPNCGHGDWNNDTVQFNTQCGFACDSCGEEYVFEEVNQESI